MAIPARPTGGAPIESAWGDVVHDTVVAQDIQTGVASVVIASGQFAGQLVVTFPRPFAAAPVVVATIDSTGPSHLVSTTAVGPTAATVVIRHRSDGVSPATYLVRWVAIGPRT